MAIDVAKLVHNAFKSGSKAVKDVFRKITYYQNVQGVGENPSTTKKFNVIGVLKDISAEQTEFSSVQTGDLLAIFSTKSIPFKPVPLEALQVDSFGDFTVIQVETDAAKSVWKLQVRKK